MHLTAQLLTAAAICLPLHALGARAAVETKRENALNLIYEEYRNKDTGDGEDCSHGCELPIDITVDKNDDRICVAKAPSINFKNTSAANREWKKIVWKLPIAANPSEQRFAFHSSEGISILKNPKKQLVNGGPGDDDAHPNKDTHFHIYNKHRIAHDKDIYALYIPIILRWPLDANGNVNKDNPSVCAAIDPKIVNG